MSNKVRSIAKARERQQAKDGQITVTLARLVSSALQTKENPAPALHHLLGQHEMPIRQSFLIGKIAKAVFEELEQYQKSYTDLYEKYAEKDDQGKARIIDAEGKQVAEGQSGRYDVSKEKQPEVQKELAELLATEVTIPGQQVKVSELQGVKIAPAYMMALDWLIGD